MGFQIQQWNAAISLAKELAEKFEDIRYIGWDFALTKNGRCVVEGNDFGGVVMPQIAYKRGLKKNLESIINWKPDKKFCWQ